MGVYINPPSGTKEDWLRANAVDDSFYPVWADVPDDCLPVCLVLNPGFTAAGVAFSEDEMRAFADPLDPRPRRWYMVPKSLLTADVIGEGYVRWLKEMGVLA